MLAPSQTILCAFRFVRGFDLHFLNTSFEMNIDLLIAEKSCFAFGHLVVTTMPENAI